MKHKLAIIPVLIAALLVQACDRSTVLRNIESALVIALSAASVSGAVPVEYQRYVDAALAGIACQSAEAATNDSTAVKAARMTACLSGVLAPVLPPGTPQDLVNKAHNLALALQRILSGLPAPQAVRPQADSPDAISAKDYIKAMEILQRAEEGLKKWRSR